MCWSASAVICHCRVSETHTFHKPPTRFPQSHSPLAAILKKSGFDSSVLKTVDGAKTRILRTLPQAANKVDNFQSSKLGSPHESSTFRSIPYDPMIEISHLPAPLSITIKRYFIGVSWLGTRLQSLRLHAPRIEEVCKSAQQSP